MKTVFTDISHIAHLWANQLQDNAKNSGNFFFREKTIYSYGYHFPIAKHVKNADCKEAVLFTERSYSVTTSKHIRVVEHAASHKDIIYCYNPDNTHADNFKAWQNTAERVAENLKKAKKPEKYLSGISSIKARVDRYCEFFSLTMPESLATLLSIGNKSEYAAYTEKKGTFEKAEKEKEQKEVAKKHKAALKKWLAGEGHRLYVRDQNDYLRVRDNRIETTQGVQIPMELGKRLWHSIKDNSLAIGAKVLDYTVEEVGKSVRIGCHNFKTDYLIKFGNNIFAN